MSIIQLAAPYAATVLCVLTLILVTSAELFVADKDGLVKKCHTTHNIYLQSLVKKK